MNRKLSIKRKNKKQAKVPPRITNETVAEHREQIIAGGRKFKYPIQYARHRLVFNAIIIAILGAFLLLVAGWVLMYPMQNSSGVAYRISRVIPLPVGSINGEAVLYSDYLASYRSSAYYLNKNPEVRLKNDGQVQLNHIKRQSLDLAERVAYARQLARQHNISISDSDVDTVIERERITANGRVSQDTYDASIKMLFGESANDYRFRTANAMLESRVAFAVDVKAKQQIEAVMAALKQGKSFDEAVGKIEKEVEESVKYHKISDVEVGSFLSGGVDSSYVVATALPDKTFSVGFDNKGFNETVYAKELSDSLGINNYSKLITPDEFFEGINKVQYYSDEPHANLSSVPLYFLSKLASEQVKVVLSGEGADELFAGYNEYADALPQRMYRKLPFSLRNKLYKKYKDRKHFSGKTIIMKYGQKVEDRYIGPAQIMSDEQANSLVTSKYKNTETSRDLTRKYYDEVKDMDDTSKRLYLDMKLWIVEDILLKADKMTMANSIELRVPLLDKKMWELARTIPVKHKVHNEITKYAF